MTRIHLLSEADASTGRMTALGNYGCQQLDPTQLVNGVVVQFTRMRRNDIFRINYDEIDLDSVSTPVSQTH
jgi:hypothetical protein